MKRKIFFLFLTLIIFKALTILSLAKDKLEFPAEEFSKRIKGIGKEDTEPVNFYAENLDYRRYENLLIGEGSVDIEYQGMSLQADRVEYNTETGDALASGNVVVEDGSSVLFCESLELNLKTRIGVIYNGELFLEPTYYLTGVEIRRLGLDKYKIINGYYTACQKPVPAWSIRTSEATAEVEGMLHAKGASFAVKKIPVFYSPYLLLPIKTKRATGILPPKFGYSTRNGLRWNQPFFWAINDYADATFSADYQGKRGLGAEGNFSYMIDDESFGSINGYGIKTRSRFHREGGTSRRSERWNVFAFHQQSLPENLRVVAKVDIRSDENFNRDFGETFEERTKSSDIKSDSYLFITRTWEKNALLMDVSVFEDRIHSRSAERFFEGKFKPEKEKKATSRFQHFPELKFISLSQPILGADGLFNGLESLSGWLPIRFQLEASIASLKKKRKINDYTEDEVKRSEFNTERFDIHPSISLPLSYRNLFTLTSSIGIRETFYTHRLQNNPGANLELLGKSGAFKRTNLSGDSGLSREMFDLFFRLDAPRIYKTFDFDLFNIQKLKHIIEPRVEYQYIPSLEQQSIIQTDSLDFIKGREILSYSIINRLYVKYKGSENVDGEARQIARLKIYQYYDFRKNKELVKERILKRGGLDAQLRALSDLEIDFELFLLKNFSVDFDSFLNPHNSHLDRLIGNIMFEQEFLRSKIAASLAWRWTDPQRNQSLDWVEPDSNPIFPVQSSVRNTFTTLRLDLNIPYGLEFGYLGRFYDTDQLFNKDIFRQNQREFALRSKYSSQCWSVEAMYGIREFFREGGSKQSFDDRLKDDRFFWILVELETLGAISPLKL